MKNKIKILVVEHNPDDIELLLEELKQGKLDFISKVVQTSEQYCHAITHFIPDIILSDYSLPSFHGRDALVIREEMAPATPFIFVSGSIGEEKSIEYLRNGVTDYVLKEKLFTLAIKVKRALEEARELQEKKITQQQLAHNTGLLERAQQLAHMGSWELNFQDNILILSDEGCRIFGFPAKQNKLSLETWSSLVHPEDREAVMQAIREGRDTQKETSYSHRIILKDGSIRDIYSESKFELDENGNATGLYGIMQDVTERKKTEKALHDAYEEKNTVLERIDDGFFAIDKNSIVTYWNKKAELLSHTKKEDVLGKSLNEVFAVAGSKAFYDHYSKALSENTTIHFREFSVRTGKWLEVSAYASDNGLSVYFKDVTENKITGDKIKESELRYRSLNEQATDAICITDEKMKFIDINPYACGIFGYTREEALQLSLPDILFAEDLKDNPLRVTELQMGKTIRNERRLKRKDGSAVDMAVSTKIMADGKLIMFGHDITERKKTEQEIRWLINNTEESFILLNRKLEITSFNDRARKLYSKFFGKELQKGKYIVDYAQPHRFQKVKDTYDHVLNGEEKNDEIAFPVEGDKIKNFSLKYKPAKDETGNIIGVFVSAVDITERKKAEQEKEFERRDKEALINTTNDLIWSVSNKFKLIAANKAFINSLTAFNVHLQVGDNLMIEEKFPGDYLVFWKELYSKTLSGNPHTEEIYFPASANQPASWREITFNPIRNENSITGIACYSRDVTASKDFKNKLIDTNNKLQTAQQIASLGYWELDMDMDTLFWSDQVYAIWEVTPARLDLNFKNFFETIHPDDKEIFLSTQQNAMDGKDKMNIEHRIILPSGKIKFVHEKGELVYNESGKPIRFEGTVQDITERKELETLLNRANSLARIGSWEVDILENTLYWSSITKEIHEVAKDFTPDVETAINFYKEGESRNLITALLAKAIDSGVPWDVELQIVTAKNNERWVRTIGEAIFEKGKCIKISGSFQDITIRKVSEIHLGELNENIARHAKELAISNAELEQFAYVASHDLQEPLRMITSFLTQLEKRYASVLDEKGKKYIDFAVSGAKRMRQIILDLLDFSRVGQTDENKEDLDLNELVTEIQMLLQKKIEDKKATITADNLPVVHAHRAPLHQVFQNLIGNALKYSVKDVPAVVHISVSESEDEWQFAVADNGIGIAAEYFEKIFIIFQRLHNKDEYSGTGMGLAVTKKIIENMGGKIWVESSEGIGSTFYFTLKK